MNEPSLMIVGGKKRGRPRTNEPKGSHVTAWIHPDEHDRLIQLANRKEQSVSETLRQILRKQLRIEQ